ncbi:MAG: hypothetical protein ACKPKO_11980 [Candidatus Fonsibacter sp.]
MPDTDNLALPRRVARGQASDASTFVSPEVRTVISPNIQLNGIPDKLIICVRKVVANLRCNQTDNSRRAATDSDGSNCC